MTREKLHEAERRSVKLVTYVTKGEAALLVGLSIERESSVSDLVRDGILRVTAQYCDDEALKTLENPEGSTGATATLTPANSGTILEK
jgi:hypothetical protein